MRPLLILLLFLVLPLAPSYAKLRVKSRLALDTIK